MERREFLTTLAATSGCALAAATLEGADDSASGDQAPKKYGVKITVLRRGFEKEFVEQLKTGPKGPCTRFTDGQEFTVTSQWAMPEKFCEWAYADIRALHSHGPRAGKSHCGLLHGWIPAGLLQGRENRALARMSHRFLLRRRIRACPCVALGQAPRRTVEYACGALGRAPCIHARLHRLATKSGEKAGWVPGSPANVVHRRPSECGAGAGRSSKGV